MYVFIMNRIPTESVEFPQSHSSPFSTNPFPHVEEDALRLKIYSGIFWRQMSSPIPNIASNRSFEHCDHVNDGDA